MSFKRYPKIHRLGKEETDDILLGSVHVEEKIDGANASIWFEDGEIKCGSRSRVLTEGFNGFVEYVKNHPTLPSLFSKYPDCRLNGEWLVRHTISYNETAYKKFYLFDITSRLPDNFDDDVRESFWTKQLVLDVAKEHSIDTPFYFGMFQDPSVDDLKQFVGKTVLGTVGEGIVIKNESFVNNFGDHCHAKIVSDSFKEDNGITFGGNNKSSETYLEMYIVNKYMTLTRIQKIINKTQPEIDKKLDLEHTARIINSAYHDMLTEEIWLISKKVDKISFRSLQRLAMKKASQIYKDLLTGDISVADKTNE